MRGNNYITHMWHECCTHKGFVDLFYDFWIQKSHHFYGFWIQKFLCPSSQFLYPETAEQMQFLDPEIVKMDKKFWIQKL